MMKINCFKCGIVIIALGVIIFTGCETTGGGSSSSTTADANSATLVIKRSANMGSGLFLNVSIDGKRVGAVSRGQSYTGSLSAGPHVVSVILEPNNLNLPPTVKRLTIEKGKTYAFTAMWEGDTVVLR